MSILDKIEVKLTGHIPYYTFKYKNITAIGYYYHTTYDEETVIKAFLDRKYVLESDNKLLKIKLSQCLQVP